MNERTSYFTEYVLKKQKYEEFVKDVCEGLKESDEKDLRSPKELTYLYDEYIRKQIQDESHVDDSAGAATQKYFTDNKYEELFICLTHLRRETKGGDDEEAVKKFCAMYEAVKRAAPNLLANGLLYSFGLHYLIFKADENAAALLQDKKKEEEVQKGYFEKYFDRSFMDAALKCTYSTCVFSIIEKNYKILDEKAVSKHYNCALRSIEEAILFDKDYATYYSVKARILLWGLKNDVGGKHELKEIRDLLNTAIRKERYSDTGLRKRTEYLKTLSDVNLYEIESKIEESEKKMREIEANSVKKMAAFSAFVSFAVGLLSKLMSSGTLVFKETIGYLLVLLGISITIFAFFDLIILGPYALAKKKEDEKAKCKIPWGFVAKAVVEIVLCATFIVIGINFGL